MKEKIDHNNFIQDANTKYKSPNSLNNYFVKMELKNVGLIIFFIYFDKPGWGLINGPLNFEN